MKEIKRPSGNPTCDFCGEVAIYDAPTNQGPWAYLCKDCFKHYTGKLAQACGYKFPEKEE